MPWAGRMDGPSARWALQSGNKDEVEINRVLLNHVQVFWQGWAGVRVC
jgi:hypothetical protein